MNNSVIYRSGKVCRAGSLKSPSPLVTGLYYTAPSDAGIPAKPGWLGCHVIKMLILLRFYHFAATLAKLSESAG